MLDFLFGKVPSIMPEFLFEELKKKKRETIVIDLRPTEIYTGTNGHIPEAVSFPASQLKEKYDVLKQYKDKKIVLVDKSGKEAKAVARMLIGKGIKNIAFMPGGMKKWYELNFLVHH